MVGVYQSLLRLYPAEHRREFGEEMCSVFQDASSDIAAEGILARTEFLVREIAGLLSGAACEHLRRFNVFDIGAVLSTRRFNMRNGFRFPKATAILMTIILLGIIVAIRKGEAIAYSLPHVNQPIAPIHSVPSGLLSPLPLFFAAFYAIGLLGWAVLFAMRRSGIHRLEDVHGQTR